MPQFGHGGCLLFACCFCAPEFSVGLVCFLRKTNGYGEKTEIEKGDDFLAVVPQAVFVLLEYNFSVPIVVQYASAISTSSSDISAANFCVCPPCSSNKRTVRVAIHLLQSPSTCLIGPLPLLP